MRTLPLLEVGLFRTSVCPKIKDDGTERPVMLVTISLNYETAIMILNDRVIKYIAHAHKIDKKNDLIIEMILVYDWDEES